MKNQEYGRGPFWENERITNFLECVGLSFSLSFSSYYHMFPFENLFPFVETCWL